MGILWFKEEHHKIFIPFIKRLLDKQSAAPRYYTASLSLLYCQGTLEFCRGHLLESNEFLS